MKYDNVKIGQRVQAKVDIYQTPHRKDKGRLLVEIGTCGVVCYVGHSEDPCNISVKWDDVVVSSVTWGRWWCNHEHIRKEKDGD